MGNRVSRVPRLHVGRWTEMLHCASAGSAAGLAAAIPGAFGQRSRRTGRRAEGSRRYAESLGQAFAAAFRAGRLFARPHKQLEPAPAGFALVFVKRHGIISTEDSKCPRGVLQCANMAELFIVQSWGGH